MGHFKNGACFGPDSFFHCKKAPFKCNEKVIFSLNVMKRFIFSFFYFNIADAFKTRQSWIKCAEKHFICIRT